MPQWPEWLNLILRTAGLFVLLLLAIPLLGRKPLSGMTMFDYMVGLVTAVMIGLIALNAVNIGLGLLGLFVWFIAILIIQYAVQKSKWAHDHFYGKEIVVIKEGKVLEENLQSARLTGEELLSQLRRKNVFQVADVEFAVMEANGDITTLLKRDKLPMTPKDMQLTVNPMKEPRTVILDGKILDEPLTDLGVNRQWLHTELAKMGVNAENVFIGQVDSMGDLYVDLFDDSIQLPQPTTKDLLHATLKKTEADFIQFGLETQNTEWQETFKRHAKTMNEITNKLEPYLKT